MRSTRFLAVAVLAAAAACSDRETPVVANATGTAPVLSAARDGIEGSYIVVLNEGGNVTGGTGGIANYRLPPIFGWRIGGPAYTVVIVALLFLGPTVSAIFQSVNDEI